MMRLITAILLIFMSNSVPATEEDKSEAFAYAYHPYLKMHVMLFRIHCPIKDKSWEGVAKMKFALSGNELTACWGWMNSRKLSVGVCPANAEKQKIGECIYISKDRFQDVAEMKKQRAFK